jgi:enoyl-CoA hydratase/carnithine racemase
MRSSVADTTLVANLDGGVLTLTLNRPERRYAIDPELRDALAAAHDRRDPAFRGT